MKTLQQMVQDEINRLMSTKIAKSTDAQLIGYEKNRMNGLKQQHQRMNDPVALSMKNDILAGMSPKEWMTKYKYKSDAYYYKLKAKYNSEIGKESNLVLPDSQTVEMQAQDVINGMSCREFMAKWDCDRQVYYRRKQRFCNVKTLT